MRIKFLVLILVSFISLESRAGSLPTGTLEPLMNNSYKKEITYAAPADDALQRARELFESLLKTKIIDPKAIREWEALGFTTKQITEGNSTFAVVMEKDGAQGTGSGFYIIRLSGTGVESGLVLEAPHRPSDLYTHQIIFKLLIEGGYSAAAWNTTHRTNADLGKESSSYYNAFTEAVARAYSNPKIIQLHGFEGTKHEITEDAILSSTKKQVPLSVYEQVATCLQGITSPQKKVLLYYLDVMDLGGTLNINAKKFYAANPNGLFFHLETVASLRTELRDNQAVRSAFTRCFKR